MFRACALRVLGTSALRAFTFLQAFASTVRNRRSASLASSLAALVAHWAHFGLFRSSIRNSRLATLPLASLLCSLDFRFACFAHCARRSSVPQAAASVRPAKNTRNDVHAVISDLSLVLPILCQCSAQTKGLSTILVAGEQAIHNSQWSSRTFAPALNSAWSYHCARKLACGTPASLGLLRAASRTARALRALPQFAMVALLRLTACSSPLLIGLTSRCFAHSARASCAPRHKDPKRSAALRYAFTAPRQRARRRCCRKGLQWRCGPGTVAARRCKMPANCRCQGIPAHRRRRDTC